MGAAHVGRGGVGPGAYAVVRRPGVVGARHQHPEHRDVWCSRSPRGGAALGGGRACRPRPSGHPSVRANPT